MGQGSEEKQMKTFIKHNGGQIEKPLEIYEFGEEGETFQTILNCKKNFKNFWKKLKDFLAALGSAHCVG